MTMDNATHGRIVSFIWGIADDVLRDVYVRGKYRDVILPMAVIPRLDCLLEPTKDDVLRMKANLDQAGIANQDAALRHASRQAFFNASPFTLRSLLSSPKQLKANFQAYLDGFSQNVQEIIDKFDFRNQLGKLDVRHLATAAGDELADAEPEDLNEGIDDRELAEELVSCPASI